MFQTHFFEAAKKFAAEYGSRPILSLLPMLEPVEGTAATPQEIHHKLLMADLRSLDSVSLFPELYYPPGISAQIHSRF